jgi:hypothetical protein
MKRNIGWRLLLCLFLSRSVQIMSAPGCQDNSRHLVCCLPDYKNWHYVVCNCPCELQYELRPDGHCSECEHLRRILRLRHPEAIDPTTILNVEGLRAAAMLSP